jgi:hypothetical protein
MVQPTTEAYCDNQDTTDKETIARYKMALEAIILVSSSTAVVLAKRALYDKTR